jgi:cell division protein ZapA
VTDRKSSAGKSSVKVTIVGEEYSIRSDAPPEHTRAVAAYVDAAIRKVMNAGVVVETHKAAILAALQITDELFRSNQSSAELVDELRELGVEVKRWLPPAKRGGKQAD